MLENISFVFFKEKVHTLEGTYFKFFLVGPVLKSKNLVGYHGPIRITDLVLKDCPKMISDHMYFRASCLHLLASDLAVLIKKSHKYYNSITVLLFQKNQLDFSNSVLYSVVLI